MVSEYSIVTYIIIVRYKIKEKIVKVMLEKEDIEKLMKDKNFISLLDWEGSEANIYKTKEGKYYIFRVNGYERCTDLMDIDSLVNVTLSEGVVLNAEDYYKLLAK